MASPSADLDELKLPELQDIAANLGINRWGRKQDLIERIRAGKDGAVSDGSVTKSPSRSRSKSPSRRAARSPKKDAASPKSPAEQHAHHDDSITQQVLPEGYVLVSHNKDRIRHATEWMRSSRTVCNFLVLMEFLYVLSVKGPLFEQLEMDGKANRGFMPPFTAKFYHPMYYTHLFYWVFFYFFLPLLIAVIFNWETKIGVSKAQRPKFSVLTFAITRYCLFYIYESSPITKVVFQYVDYRTFTVTCAVTVIMAFWDSIRYVASSQIEHRA